jgi:YesN/AraC family two-component response regulator
MEDFNKILESVAVRLSKAQSIQLTHPIMVDGYYDVENHIMLLENCKVRFGKFEEIGEVGEIFFIPAGKMTNLALGMGPSVRLTNDEYKTAKKKYLVKTTEDEIKKSIAKGKEIEHISQISFETKVFDSVNFFSSLDIPPFVIRNNERIATLIKKVVFETNNDKPGGKRIIASSMVELVIEIVRHIIDNRLFVEQLTTNATYFKDPRLVDIFNFIQKNLGGNLSNKRLAKVAGVSEDYVGQYFKIMTGINPQDYIEYQRMEAAVDILRTTKKSIRDIGKEVGYKDTAYFCRRFKMMFGIPAAKMRKRENLLNA